MLRDAFIEMPHAGGSSDDHTRLTGLRMQRHEFDAKCVHGMSGARDLQQQGLRPAARWC